MSVDWGTRRTPALPCALAHRTQDEPTWQEERSQAQGGSACCGAFEIHHWVSLKAGYGTLLAGGPRGSEQVSSAHLDPLQKVGNLFYSPKLQATNKSKP